MATAHDFSLKAIDGGILNLADFMGKKILLVNTASECGLTPQYAQLQELHEQFSDKVAVIGFPANNFGAQEPGNETQIKEFCTLRYGVTFPLSAKISVKGDDIHPLYQWLTQKSQNGQSDNEVQWNFQKYLINEKGQWQDVFSPTTSVLDEVVLTAIGISL